MVDFIGDRRPKVGVGRAGVPPFLGADCPPVPLALDLRAAIGHHLSPLPNPPHPACASRPTPRSPATAEPRTRSRAPVGLRRHRPPITVPDHEPQTAADAPEQARPAPPAVRPHPPPRRACAGPRSVGPVGAFRTAIEGGLQGPITRARRTTDAPPRPATTGAGRPRSAIPGRRAHAPTRIPARIGARHWSQRMCAEAFTRPRCELHVARGGNCRHVVVQSPLADGRGLHARYRELGDRRHGAGVRPEATQSPRQSSEKRARRGEGLYCGCNRAGVFTVSSQFCVAFLTRRIASTYY